MRAHAAARFPLRRFGVWRLAMGVLAAAQAACAFAWWAAPGSPAAGLPAVAVAAAALALGGWLIAVQRAPRPVDLAWDGARWSLDTDPPDGAAPRTGDLHVALDLGAFMLLRFTADAPSSARRTVWLPAQRAGHEGDWHALRCAVYSPRPDAGADAAPDV